MSKLDIRIEPATRSVPAALPSPLGFGRHFAARMFTQHYTAGRGWHDAVIGPYQSLALDPAAQVFHCGQMIFEGTKAYSRPDGHLNLFRVEKNAERVKCRSPSVVKNWCASLPARTTTSFRSTLMRNAGP